MLVLMTIASMAQAYEVRKIEKPVPLKHGPRASALSLSASGDDTALQVQGLESYLLNLEYVSKRSDEVKLKDPETGSVYGVRLISKGKKGKK